MAATAAMPAADDEHLRRAALLGRATVPCVSASWPSSALLVTAAGLAAFTSREMFALRRPRLRRRQLRIGRRGRLRRGSAGRRGRRALGGVRVDRRRRLGRRLDDGRHVGLVRSGFAARDRRRRLGDGGRRPRRFDGGPGGRQLGPGRAAGDRRDGAAAGGAGMLIIVAGSACSGSPAARVTSSATTSGVATRPALAMASSSDGLRVDRRRRTARRGGARASAS